MADASTQEVTMLYFEPEPTLDLLARGKHEQCNHCGMPFISFDGMMLRYRAPDGRYYCNERHYRMAMAARTGRKI